MRDLTSLLRKKRRRRRREGGGEEGGEERDFSEPHAPELTLQVKACAERMRDGRSWRNSHLHIQHSGLVDWHCSSATGPCFKIIQLLHPSSHTFLLDCGQASAMGQDLWPACLDSDSFREVWSVISTSQSHTVLSIILLSNTSDTLDLTAIHLCFFHIYISPSLIDSWASYLLCWSTMMYVPSFPRRKSYVATYYKNYNRIDNICNIKIFADIHLLICVCRHLPLRCHFC